MRESKWMFVPDLMISSSGVSEYTTDESVHEVTATLTFDHQNLMNSCLTSREWLITIYRHSLKAFMWNHTEPVQPNVFFVIESHWAEHTVLIQEVSKNESSANMMLKRKLREP